MENKEKIMIVYFHRFQHCNNAIQDYGILQYTSRKEQFLILKSEKDKCKNLYSDIHKDIGLIWFMQTS